MTACQKSNSFMRAVKSLSQTSLQNSFSQKKKKGSWNSVATQDKGPPSFPMCACGFGLCTFLCRGVMMLKRTATQRKVKKAAWRDPSSSQLFCPVIVSGLLVSLRIYYRKDVRSFLHEIPLQRKEDVFQTQNRSRQLPIYYNINKKYVLCLLFGSNRKDQLHHSEQTTLFSYPSIKQVIDNQVFWGFRAHFEANIGVLCRYIL